MPEPKKWRADGDTIPTVSNFKDTVLQMATLLPECEATVEKERIALVKVNIELKTTDELNRKLETKLAVSEGRTAGLLEVVADKDGIIKAEKGKRNKARLVAVASIVLNVALIIILL